MPVKQILLVDDSLPWQRFVREMFESEADLKIIATATDGSEAIQKARELQPDVILMDVSLPGLNGFEATRQIRTLSPASKILFLSEHSSTDLIEAALEVGGSGYVWKSNCRSHLLTAIRVILRDQQFVSRRLRNLL
jgi:DNA-binding NarL/FixJ family response regulator